MNILGPCSTSARRSTSARPGSTADLDLAVAVCWRFVEVIIKYLTAITFHRVYRITQRVSTTTISVAPSHRQQRNQRRRYGRSVCFVRAWS
eukprot:CCRYP_015319-RA/>CCRYP_015319-RA protein AED:0.14 eAED:0.14 QI:147/0/1/1/0/0.5/2/1327/90